MSAEFIAHISIFVMNKLITSFLCSPIIQLIANELIAIFKMLHSRNIQNNFALKK